MKRCIERWKHEGRRADVVEVDVWAGPCPLASGDAATVALTSPSTQVPDRHGRSSAD